MNENKDDFKIVTIGTLKGGVGKSTVLFNIAGELASRGSKVLVMDLDPQGNTTTNFRIDNEEFSNSVNNCFIEEKQPALIVIREPITGVKIDILPSNISLTQVDMQLISRPGRERTLLRYFSQNIKFFEQYDYVLIDTNPSMSVLNQNAFVVADHILIITEASVNSLNGSELFIKLWTETTDMLLMDNNIDAVIINKLEGNQKSSKEFLEYLKNGSSKTSKLLLDSKISKAVCFKDHTELENMPISFSNSTKGAVEKSKKEIKDLVDELVSKGVFYE